MVEVVEVVEVVAGYKVPGLCLSSHRHRLTNMAVATCMVVVAQTHWLHCYILQTLV